MCNDLSINFDTRFVARFRQRHYGITVPVPCGMCCAARCFALMHGALSTAGGVSNTGLQDMLGSDAVMVSDPLMQAIQLTDPIAQWGYSPNIALLASLGTSSPLQIEINGNSTHDGTWLPLNPRAKCQPEHYDHLWPNRSTCQINRDNWTRKDGWADVVVQVGENPFFGSALLKNVTGIRYAWGTNPCCPALNRNNIGCPPASCPIQSFNSSLPAVPFWASIRGGKCAWVSTTGPPPKGFKAQGFEDNNANATTGLKTPPVLSLSDVATH